MGGGSPLTPLTIPGGTKGPPMGFGFTLSERARAGTEGEINPPPHFGIRGDPWDPKMGPENRATLAQGFATNLEHATVAAVKC